MNVTFIYFGAVFRHDSSVSATKFLERTGNDVIASRCWFAAVLFSRFCFAARCIPLISSPHIIYLSIIFVAVDTVLRVVAISGNRIILLLLLLQYYCLLSVA